VLLEKTHYAEMSFLLKAALLAFVVQQQTATIVCNANQQKAK
jgi:hypothetical protein